MKVLITAGATREYIDDIRYITNPASGKMGYAIADAFKSRGIEATLVRTPNNLDVIEEVEDICVEGTQEMIDATLNKLSEGYDVLISTAAISDFQLKGKTQGKIKSAVDLTLHLIPTPKLLEVVRKKHPNLKMVGFKAEYDIGREKLIESARDILERYKLSFVCANDVSSGIFSVDETELTIVFPDEVIDTGRVSKSKASEIIVDKITSL